MTQLQSARKGVITPEMVRVAMRENVTPEFIRDGVARGAIVIPANVRHLAGAGGGESSDEFKRRRRALSEYFTTVGVQERRPPRARHAETDSRDAGREKGISHHSEQPGHVAQPPSAMSIAAQPGTAELRNQPGADELHTQPDAAGLQRGVPNPYAALPKTFMYPLTLAGHPTFDAASAYWVNQTVTQRRAWLNDAEHCRGEVAPKHLDPTGIGRSITTKLNANQGASPVSSNTQEELDKLRHAILYGADTVMDLSTGGKLDDCRQRIIDNSVVPVGTVPIYSMIAAREQGIGGREQGTGNREQEKAAKRIEDLTYDDILREVEHQARQGVDYFTIHAGILKEHLPLIRGRITGLVSRGGSLLAKWMIHHNRQNPMYELFDEISAIMREYDVTYSLGDGVRPGCLADASDPAQIAELHVLAELVQRAREAGVQVMVEGPGHVPLNEIAWNMEHQRTVCDDAPFYVLGPLVTDVFPGYDHITSAIGATEAARTGAAMLCYVTPKEHVGLPKAEDVKAGCIAYKIAAHAGDIARGVRAARRWDDDLSKARAALNWPLHFELAFDGDTARALHDEDLAVDTDFCAMCGHDWCSMRISKEIQDWASGKAEGFTPLKIASKSPGLTPEQAALLATRGAGKGTKLSAGVPLEVGGPGVSPALGGPGVSPEVGGPGVSRGKLACHSDNVADAAEAKRVQKELGTLHAPRSA
ncbi:MAG: phosphomethylpyrimidine synthase ThiC [Phycisphaerae bacterium]